MTGPNSRTTPPLVGIPSIAALGTLSLVDSLLGGGAVDGRYALALAGLAAAFGGLLSVVLALALRVFPRIPRLGPLVGPACALASGVWLAGQLSVWSRLVGPYRNLALATGAAAMVASVADACVLAAMQQTTRGQPGRAFRLGGSARVALGIMLAAAAALATGLDRTLYVDLYPAAHLYLRISACAWLALSMSLFLREPVPRRMRVAGLIVVACLSAAPLWVLSGPEAATALQAFSRRPLASTLLATARAALDFDQDGFSAFLGGGDCNDGDASVNPAAEEIPDNGRDDNCFGGDAHATVEAEPPRWESTSTDPKVNLVLITIDTLRWDRLGPNDAAFGAAGKDTMPNLSRWAEQATNFQRAYSTGSWTSVSLASIHRGRYPRHLAWQPHYETDRYRMVTAAQAEKLQTGETIVHMFPLAWHDPRPTLAQLLVGAGMRTGAVVDDDFTLVLASSLGTSRGFQSYREVQPGAAFRVRSDDATTATMAIAELDRMRRGGQPYFLWIHFFGPHGPSVHHPDTRKDEDSDTGRYDHEVRYADAQVGRVLDALRDDLKDTAVFVTSDHGEDLKGTYRSHGTSLSDSLIRVPLVAKVPGWPTGSVEGLVSLVDLMPTMLALVGAAPPADLDGEDLAVQFARPKRRRILISDNWRFDADGRALMNSTAAYDGERKLELDRLTHTFLYYVQSFPDDLPDYGPSSPQSPLSFVIRQYLENSRM